MSQFGVSESQAAASNRVGTLANAIAADPVAQHLTAAGVVKGTHPDGRLHIVCPFEAEHSGPSSDSATTYFPAHTGGHASGAFVCLHAHCQGRPQHEFRQAVGYAEPDGFDDLGELEPAQPAPAEGHPHAPLGVDYVMHAPTAILSRPLTRWIIKHVLPKAALGVMFGESGSGKSFMALDQAIAVARGMDWQGRKVRQGRVLVIAAEGVSGFTARLTAYCRHHGIDPATLDLRVIDRPMNLMDQAVAVKLAKDIIAQGGASLIYIDTLAQVTPGANENTGEDMGKLLAHCMGIHRATGAMVVLIHHAGKDTSKGSRGWSGLKANADVEIEVSRTGDDRVMRVTKQKDGQDGAEVGFRLHTVLLGKDEDGDDITSCVAEFVVLPAKSARTAPTGDVEVLTLRVLRDLVALGGPVRAAQLIESVVCQMPPPTGADRRALKVNSALLSLAASGHVKSADGLLSLAA